MSMERPFKRLCTSPPPTSDEARNCYLDTVAYDILRLVLRYLSGRAQHENWHSHISADLVNTTLDVGGALAHAASMEFSIIGGKDGIPLGINLDVSVLRPLAYRLPLCRLVLELREEGIMPDLLHGWGAELRELVLDTSGILLTKADILAISTHCTKLASLEIYGRRVEGTLQPIWRSVGSTLARIYIGPYYSDVGYGIEHIIAARDLVEHCVNLHRVDVEMLDDETVGVLVALGARIRVLGMQGPSYTIYADWRRMYRACTNLEAVHLALHGSAVDIDVLSLMSAKLVSLQLCGRNSNMQDPYFSVLSHCSLVKTVQLTIENMYLELLRKLCECFKAVTTMTCGTELSACIVDKDIIDVVACNLTNLESFTISTHESLKGEDVSALVALPHLKSVSLRCKFITESVVTKPVEDCAVEVVDTLKDCAHLAQLEIDDDNIDSRSQLIAEAAVLYKRKDFDMFIGGVQYRTW